MNYGDLIRDAFRISWRNKFLWFFGLFVGGAGFNFTTPPTGSGGEDFDGNDFNFGQTGNSTPFTGQIGGEQFGTLVLVLGVVALVLLIGLILIVLAIISTGGLADSVAAIDRGEGRHFSSTFRAGLSNFWRVLGMGVLFWLLGVGLFLTLALLVGLPIGLTFLLTQSTTARVAVAVILGLLGIALLIVVFIPYRIVGQFALRRLVVSGERILASIGEGYGLFRQNLGRSLLVWLIQLALAIGVGIATIIVYLLLAIALIGPGVLVGILAESITAGIIVGGLGGLIFLILVLIVTGAIGSFFHSYWTLAYLRLTAPTEEQAQV